MKKQIFFFAIFTLISATTVQGWAPQFMTHLYTHATNKMKTSAQERPALTALTLISSGYLLYAFIKTVPEYRKEVKVAKKQVSFNIITAPNIFVKNLCRNISRPWAASLTETELQEKFVPKH